MKSFLNRFGSESLKDVVFGANDGIVTTFAVVAGVTGASLSPFVILALGFANLIADGFSMATGNYLGTQSEARLYKREHERESHIFDLSDHKGEREAAGILEGKGFTPDDASALSKIITKNKNFFLDFVISNRTGITETTTGDAIRGGIVIFFAFIFAGAIPLTPYIIFSGSSVQGTFIWASIFTGIALFAVGAARTYFSDESWWRGGLGMFFAGGSAAAISFGIGALARLIANGVV